MKLFALGFVAGLIAGYMALIIIVNTDEGTVQE